VEAGTLRNQPLECCRIEPKGVAGQLHQVLTEGTIGAKQ
jgi:hypothetical protein